MKVYIGRYPKASATERKVRVRIDKYDIWSLDHTLALIILPALKLFKEDGRFGCPAVVYDFANKDLVDEHGQPNEAGDEYARKVWDEIIDKMIFAFENVVNEGDWEDQFVEVVREANLDHKESEFLDTGEYKFDKEGHAAYDARIQEGLDLFAKYYRNLWT